MFLFLFPFGCTSLVLCVVCLLPCSVCLAACSLRFMTWRNHLAVFAMCIYLCLIACGRRTVSPLDESRKHRHGRWFQLWWIMVGWKTQFNVKHTHCCSTPRSQKGEQTPLTFARGYFVATIEHRLCIVRVYVLAWLLYDM